MKKVLVLFMCLVVFIIKAVFADDMPTISFGTIDISSGTNVCVNNYLITTPVNIINYGKLSGNIIVDPNTQFSLRNYGIINAAFNMSSGDILTQYVSSISEMTGLNVNGGTYIPTIRNDFSGTINASDLINLSANKIKIEKDNLTIKATIPQVNELANVLDIDTFASVNFIIINYDGSVYALPTFNGTTTYSFEANPNPMYVYWIDNGKVRSARNTDYTAFLGKSNKRAVFLNNLRALDPSNQTLAVLDRASTMTELTSEMSKSMFFNPLVLNDPVLKTLTQYDLVVNDDIGKYVGAKVSLDRNQTGTFFNLGFSKGDFGFEASPFVGMAYEKDNYKQGNATVYGGDFWARYQAVTIGAKFRMADWKDISILSDEETKNHAKSQLFYTFLDFSPKIYWFYPIARLNYTESQIEEFSKDDFYLSYGGKIVFSDQMFGLKESYGLYAIKAKDEIDFGLTADWHFVDDGMIVTGQVSINKLSVEIKTSF